MYPSPKLQKNEATPAKGGGSGIFGEHPCLKLLQAMIRICRQCRRSRRPIQLESRGAPEKLLAFRRFEWPELAAGPGVIKIPTSTMTMWRYCPQCAALGWLVFFESDGFIGIFTFQKLHLCVFFFHISSESLMVQDVTNCFSNFLRQNQHFFSQKQTKILLDWLHEAVDAWQFFLLWSCKFRLKVVVGGKGSTWRGATVVSTT